MKHAKESAKGTAGQLSDAVRTVLATPRPLPASAKRYLQDVFDGAALDEALQREEASELEPLLELCLELPDSNFRTFEPLLAKADADAERITQELGAALAGAVLVLDEGRVRHMLRPQDALQLAERLNLGHGAGPLLRQALREMLPADQALAVLADMRSWKVDNSPGADEFLAALAQGLLTRDKLTQTLRLGARLLYEAESGAGLWSVLVGRCQKAAHALRLAEQQREQLAGANLESLFSRGIRFPHVDEHGAREEQELCTAIGLAMFGKNPMPEVPQEVDLGQMTDVRELLDK